MSLFRLCFRLFLSPDSRSFLSQILSARNQNYFSNRLISRNLATFSCSNLLSQKKFRLKLQLESDWEQDLNQNSGGVNMISNRCWQVKRISGREVTEIRSIHSRFSRGAWIEKSAVHHFYSLLSLWKFVPLSIVILHTQNKGFLPENINCNKKYRFEKRCTSETKSSSE